MLSSVRETSKILRFCLWRSSDFDFGIGMDPREMPRRDSLGRSDSMFDGDRRDDRVGEEITAATQRAPRFGDDAVLAVVRQRFDLREVRMQFDLIDRR